MELVRNARIQARFLAELAPHSHSFQQLKYVDIDFLYLSSSWMISWLPRCINFVLICVKGASFANADFTFSNLSHSDFSGADLSGAIFENTHMRATNFSGADLSSASSLAPEQLALACGDEKTKLPEGFTIERCGTLGE